MTGPRPHGAHPLVDDRHGSTGTVVRALGALTDAAARTSAQADTPSPGPASPMAVPAPTVHWPVPGAGAAATRATAAPAASAHPAAPSSGPVSAGGRPLRAVALRYDPFAGPPRVVATGRGHVAEALLARARDAGVPIEAQPDLVDVLMTLRIDQVIPPALYVAVAQVLAWAYLVDERVGRQRPPIEAPRR